MVEYSSAELDQTFAALADATRRGLLQQLAAGESTVGELAAPYDTSFAAISKHLDVLERAGLVSRQRVGRMRECRIVATPLRAAFGWIETYRQFWEGRLDELARFLEETPTKESPTWEQTKPPLKRSPSAARTVRRPRKSSGLGRKRKR